MRLSISTKISMMSIILLVLTATSIAWLYYTSSTRLLIEQTLYRYSDHVNEESARIRQVVKFLKEDVSVLSHTPPIQGMLRARRNNNYDVKGNSTLQQWKNRLNDIFKFTLQDKEDYLQVRLLDENGIEQVRADRIGGRIIIASDKALQDKSGEQYFKSTMALNPNQIYISEITLNREHGKIAQPLTPVLRVATQITEEVSGKKSGILIVNYNIGTVLRYIENVYTKNRSSLFITNDHGHYLAHPDKKKEFGFEYGRRFRIQEDIPEISPLYLPQDVISDGRANIIDYIQMGTAHKMVYKKIFYNNEEKRFIFVGMGFPLSDILDAVKDTVFTQMRFVAGFIVIGVILLLGFSRYLLHPLQQIIHAIQQFSEGKTNVILPTSKKDEIGLLARTFTDMSQKVDSSRMELRRLNEHLEDEVMARSSDLAVSEQRWQFALEGAQQGVWDWNIREDTVFYTPRWKKILGYEEHEIGNALNEWRSRVHPDDIPMLTDAIEKCFRGDEQVCQAEYRVRHKDGHYVWILDHGMLVERDDKGKPARMIGTHTDISERKLAEKMKDEFVSTVSHELRTPLTSIRGVIGLMNGGMLGELNEEGKKLLGVANRNTENLLLLINDILDLQKVESGEMRYQLSPVQLKAFIDQAVNDHRVYAEQLGVRYVVHEVDERIQVMADKQRLMQVMANLLSNAAKFSSEGSEVEIKVERDNHTIRVSIIDKGTGIKDDDIDKIFKKFSQADSSSTRSKGGTGLGLYITRVLIEGQGGHVDFIQRDDGGTIFFFELPEA